MGICHIHVGHKFCEKKKTQNNWITKRTMSKHTVYLRKENFSNTVKGWFHKKKQIH